MEWNKAELDVVSNITVRRTLDDIRNIASSGSASSSFTRLQKKTKTKTKKLTRVGSNLASVWARTRHSSFRPLLQRTRKITVKRCSAYLAQALFLSLTISILGQRNIWPTGPSVVLAAVVVVLLRLSSLVWHPTNCCHSYLFLLLLPSALIAIKGTLNLMLCYFMPFSSLGLLQLESSPEEWMQSVAIRLSRRSLKKESTSR